MLRWAGSPLLLLLMVLMLLLLMLVIGVVVVHHPVLQRSTTGAQLRLKAGLQLRGEMGISREGRTKVGGGRRVELTDEVDSGDASTENQVMMMARGGQR
jgi:hypothetical protein